MLCIYSQHVSGKDKFLPIEITDNDKMKITIVYDNQNRIKEFSSDISFRGGRKDSTVTNYSYYSDDMIKEQIFNTYSIESDSLEISSVEQIRYNKIVSDSLINYTIYTHREIGDVSINDTIHDNKIFLNKDNLSYRTIFYGGRNNFMTTQSDIGYDKNNQVAKTETVMVDKFGGNNIRFGYEVLEIIPQKNIFADVKKNDFLQVGIQYSLFYFFTENAPSLMKQSSSIQDNDPDIELIKFSYQLDTNGYPIQVNLIETKEGEKPTESTLYIKYEKISN